MSSIEMLTHVRDVRRRLMNPPRPVKDAGIDLKRRPPVLLQVVAAPKTAPEAAPNGPRSAWLFGPLLPAINPKYSLPDRPALSVREMQRVVESHFGVSHLDLCSHRRTKTLVMPRQIAMWIIRTLTIYSTPTIGRFFSDRDHTTVMHATSRVKQLMAIDADYRATVEMLLSRCTTLSVPVAFAPGVPS